MNVVAVIQARMGSSRLPGKMMLPLGGQETIARVCSRTMAAETVDEVVVATTRAECDLALAERARERGCSVYRGDEMDVLGRTQNAAEEAEADIVLRIAGDCPAVSPRIIDHAVRRLRERGVDYVSNKIQRTFPLGLDVEAFTMESFRRVERASRTPREREHVTVHYYENPEKFDNENITATEVFDDANCIGRTDVEIVLDEALDYLYLDRIFTDLSADQPDVRSILSYIDERNLMEMLDGVSRKTKEDFEENA